jgi:hypothetical protein
MFHLEEPATTNSASEHSSIDEMFGGSAPDSLCCAPSRGASDDEFSEYSSIDEMFGGSAPDSLYCAPSRGPSGDEFSEHSSIDEMFGDSILIRFPGLLKPSGEHPASINVPNRLSDISRLTDVDGGVEVSFEV